MLPQFVIESLIGRGGMGAVYKGIQTSLDRPVAIKLLPPAIEAQDTAYAERFKNEARLMGRLNHPAVVSVFDFGRTSDGQLYFVMEYVDGTDVQRMIAREGRLPPEHALAVTAHLCDALGYAHKQGIVHRDIKPSNVLIDYEGRVKVADFGLAKLTTSAATSGLTQTGMAMGTPDYVAPETLMYGSDVDGRADLYAVGVMLYQMLTGDIPRGMFKMPSQKFHSIDPRFDGIVRRALEQDRNERYQTSHELRCDLDVILLTPLAVAGEVSSAALPKQAAPQPRQTQPPGRTVVPSPREHASGPQQPRRGPFFEPSSPAPRPKEASSLPYVFLAMAVLAAGGWYFIKRQTPHTQPQTEEAPLTAGSAGRETKVGTQPEPPSPFTPAPSKPVEAQKPRVQPPTKAITSSAPVPPRAAGLPSSPPIVPNSPPEPETASTGERLLKLESQFQSAFERDVNAAYSEQIASLGTGYLGALERALNEATRAGRLDEAVALRDEKQRFSTHKFMPSIDPASLHNSVVRLRNTYRSTEKTYGQQKDATSLPLYDLYLGVLAKYEQELRAQGRTTDAGRVQVKRADVNERRRQRAAKVPPGTPLLQPKAQG